MKKYIVEYKNFISEDICENIIELFNESENKIDKQTEIMDNKKSILGNIITHILLIPKNNNDWKKIEMYLYKELLIKLNDYKNKIFETLDNNNSFKDILILRLNEKMYLKDFIIQKNDCSILYNENHIIKNNYYRIDNRYNFLTFILFLNDVDKECKIIFDNESIINVEKKKLIIFPDDIEYLYNLIPSILNEQYIITGQICIKNNNLL